MKYSVIWIDTVNDGGNNTINGASITRFSILSRAREFAVESSRIIQASPGGVSVGIYPIVKLIGSSIAELYVNGQKV